MRLAVLSDIHGNWEALKEVLADMDRSRIDLTACLGDNVGYGPRPDKVVRTVRQRDIPCIMGNHELAVVDEAYLEWFNPEAQESILLTRSLLSAETVEYIEGLKPSMVVGGCLCVHGTPPDSVTRYLFEMGYPELLQWFSFAEPRICFVGHTHELEIIRYDGDDLAQSYLPEGVLKIHPEDRCIINVGSVGQPRDGDNRAKYVVWDDEENTLEVRFVPYDIQTTMDKILELGFPPFNAYRLL